METAEFAAYLSAAASVTGAVIVFFGAKFNRERTEKFSSTLHVMNEDTQERITGMKTELDRLTHVQNANFTKRAEVLAEVYERFSSILVITESYVVPQFIHSETKDGETILRATKEFEDLYRYCMCKSIYFSDRSQIMTALGELQGSLNHLLNIGDPRAVGVWQAQAEIVRLQITPSLYKIRKEIREELNLVQLEP
ncbi:hypothetical protein GTP46_11445 [Duganella sp. FT135W]|uniref:DUF4760 domain-containing protein n=1 Tax=Duganella flavida TaxID=2692175 RepID=A0A6L8K7U2_9BURK|nr:hypothetical protein [Duganella flavida]MYM23260.1 hypothetical protein [Duganella flavida]